MQEYRINYTDFMVINSNIFMKAHQTIKYLAFAGVVGLWGCSSQQYAQNSNEQDDLYFSSKDRKEVVYTASTSSANYNTGNTGVAGEDNSQKNVNPEYIQQYAEQSKKTNNSTNNGTIQSGTNASDSYSADNSYYDEDYRSNTNVNLARNYNRRNWDTGTNINIIPSYGVGNFYGGSAFYDPFYDPYFYGASHYDPFFYRPFVRVRPGVIVSIGAGWGWNRWNRWNAWNSWYDPFYAWNDPFYGRYAFGGGWNDPFYYNPYRYYGGNYYGGGNVIVVNPGNNNGGNNDPRTVRYSPRSSRGSSVVNDNFDNTPRTGREGRGGRVDQSVESNPNTTTGGRNNANISDGEGRPARAVRPRGGETQEYYRPQNTPADYNGAGNRAPASVTDNNNISTPRAVRPRGNSDAGSDRNNTYSDYNSNSRPSAPTYSAPSTGRSPRSSEYSTPRSNDNWNNNNNSNWNNSRSTDTHRSSGGNSGGSYSAPSSSPRGGDGGSRSPRSPR